MQQKNILITGANGQVGQEFQLLASSYPELNLITCDRQQLDISEQAQVQQMILDRRVNLVINAAAYTSVDQAETDEALAWQVNADAVKNLALVCQAQTIPLLHISTDYVFDGTKNGAYREDMQTSPLGIYGQSKLAGEEHIRQLLPEHIILRTSWVFGQFGHNFVKSMLRLGKERLKLSIVADQFGGPTSARDIASTLLLMADRLLKALTDINDVSNMYGTFHYSGAPYTNWHGFAEVILHKAAELGILKMPQVLPISTEEYPTPARRPQNSKLDCAKIEQVFGVLPCDWQSELDAVLQHLVEQ